jgi:large subunit ribosomal protein L29
MKIEEIRGKEDSEIEFDIAQVEKEYFEMRFRSLTEGNQNPSRLGELRKDIARMKTILRERQIGVRGQHSR